MIQESLNSLADGRTTLIIAHRLATIKHADRIIVVSDQGILEDGTHETLYAQRATIVGCTMLNLEHKTRE